MKKLRAEIRIMKMAFLAIALLMAVIFGFVMAIAESIGATVMTVTVLTQLRIQRMLRRLKRLSPPMLRRS